MKTGARAKFWAIEFADGRTGLIGGGDTPWQNNNKISGLILRTIDGGRSWQSVWRGRNRISDFAFVNRRIGFAAGVNGLVLKTRNGGVTWTKLRSAPFGAIVNAIGFGSETCGVAGGHGGTAFVTRDGGESWPHRIKVTNGSFLEDLAPSGEGRFLVVAGNGTVGRIDLRRICKN